MTTEQQRFEDLFRAHYAAVTKYAIRRVGSDLAAEVVAETFLTAWRRLDEVPHDPLPWLYATGRRVVANEYRRRDRARRLTERLRRTTPPTVSPDHADGVAERMRVRAALDQLAPRDREALMLAEWEQLPAADAARALGCSTASYGVRLHRARRRIAKILRRDQDAPDGRAVALAPTTTRGTTS